MSMYTMTIKRFELGKDDKGRRTVFETEVANVKLTFELQQALKQLIEEDYEETGGDNIDYDVEVGEDGHEYEITGELVLKLLAKFSTIDDNINVDKVWKEDGINSKGEPFNVENNYYTVEVW